MHRTLVNCPVQYFFDCDFCTEHNENVQCSSFFPPKYFMFGVKRYKSKFTPDINLSVSNRLFFNTRHSHRIIWSSSRGTTKVHFFFADITVSQQQKYTFFLLTYGYVSKKKVLTQSFVP